MPKRMGSSKRKAAAEKPESPAELRRDAKRGIKEGSARDERLDVMKRGKKKSRGK